MREPLRWSGLLLICLLQISSTAHAKPEEKVNLRIISSFSFVLHAAHRGVAVAPVLCFYRRFGAAPRAKVAPPLVKRYFSRPVCLSMSLDSGLAVLATTIQLVSWNKGSTALERVVILQLLTVAVVEARFIPGFCQRLESAKDA